LYCKQKNIPKSAVGHFRVLMKNPGVQKTCDFDEENIFFNIKAVLEKKQKQKNKFYRYT